MEPRLRHLEPGACHQPARPEDADRLYRWYYGTEPPPRHRPPPCSLPPILQLFNGLELAGPDLTAATFAAGLFRLPPTGGGPDHAPAWPSVTGAPSPDRATSPADYTLLWYDATAKGADEEGVRAAE